MSVIWFLLAIPVSIECLAGLLAVRDLLRRPGTRARAPERLALPMLLAGILLWLAGPEHLASLGLAFAFVVLWQLSVFAIGRALIARGRHCALSVDTDTGD